uniref:Immunoglobulin domain-containing protein n=1 Tax=Sinocyclocheilus grahami TaxID=75366 RepID=A0A672PRF8_SINGR
SFFLFVSKVFKVCEICPCSSGVFGESVSVLEGDSVTLNSDLTEIHQDDEILWKFGIKNSLIGKINREKQIFSTYDTPGRFRDRLKLDDQTGSLTITNITTQHAGHYELEINEPMWSTKTFSVSGLRREFTEGPIVIFINSNYIFVFPGVFGEDVVTVMEGDTVTLHTDINKKEHDKMLWYFEDTRIALINGHPNTSCLYDGEGGRFRDSLKVDYKTGSLIITDITTEHAGRYEAEIIRSESSGKRQSLNRNRKCDSRKITRRISISHDDTIKTFSMIYGDTYSELMLCIYPCIYFKNLFMMTKHTIIDH